MTITKIDVFYNNMGERKSQIVAINVRFFSDISDISDISVNNKYISWHYLEQEGDDKSVYYQSEGLTNDDIEDLSLQMENIFKEKMIPAWILEKFQENINQNM